MDNEFAIEVLNVSKVYPLRQAKIDEQGNRSHEHHALKDISFRIKKGESVGIIGHNGSGKSTLLKILAGVTKPTSGSVKIRGRVASILDIGAGFHPELSGRENVFLNGQIHGFTKKEIEAKFDEIVTFSGIEKFIEEPVKNYSNGMYLRLAFSIMVHLDFDVYLFDEVMSVGDAEFSLQARKIIQELKLSNRTIIFVSHNSSELTDSQFFIQLENGIVFYSGNNSDFLGFYNQRAIEKHGEKVHLSNIVLSNICKTQSNEDIEIKKIEIYQQEELFRTDRPTHIVIVFQSYNRLVETDFVIEIRDSIGNLVSTITSIFDEQKEKLRTGLNQFSFTIPSNFFGLDFYSIRIHIVKNVLDEITYEGEKLILDDDGVSSISKSHHILSESIYFKMNFVLKEKIIKKSDLFQRGGLINVFTWKKTKLE